MERERDGKFMSFIGEKKVFIWGIIILKENEIIEINF